MSEQQRDDRVVVVTPQGMGSASTSRPPSNAGENRSDGPGQGESREASPIELVEQPAKVMRIGSMIKQLLEEVRGAPLDEAGRARLMEIHRRSISELEQGLAPELVEELERITLPFGTETPTDAELRIAQAQLVGWLEGLFHGIQTALVAQQMAARMQLEGMRHQLPPGVSGGPGPSGVPGYMVDGEGTPGQRRDGSEDPGRQTGQYL
jgi:proteasome activator-like protein